MQCSLPESIFSAIQFQEVSSEPSNRLGYARELLKKGMNDLKHCRVGITQQDVTNAQMRLNRAFESFASATHGDVHSVRDISAGIDSILDTLTTGGESAPSEMPSKETLSAILNSVVLLSPELAVVESLDHSLTEGWTARQLLNLIADACLAQDLARNGDLNFAAGFLLDGQPDIFTGQLGQGVNFLTAAVLYRLVIHSHDKKEFDLQLDTLEERVGWIVALDWLSDNLPQNAVHVDVQQRLGDLIVAATLDSARQLLPGEKIVVPLGWMTHVIIGVITAGESLFGVSTINSGHGSLRWHRPTLEPFTDYPMIDIDFTIQNVSFKELWDYYAKIVHLHRGLNKLSNPSAVSLRSEALNCHYAYWNTHGVRATALGRSKIQRSITCGTEAFKHLGKYFYPKNGSHLHEKIFILALCWTRLVNAGLAEAVRMEVKTTLAKAWLLSISNKVSAKVFGSMTEDVLVNTDWSLRKVMDRAFMKLMGEDNYDSLESLVKQILDNRPSMAMDCVAYLKRGLPSLSISQLAANVLEKMTPHLCDDSSETARRTLLWLRAEPSVLHWEDAWRMERWVNPSNLTVWKAFLDRLSKHEEDLED